MGSGNNSDALIIVTAVFLGISLVAVGLRCFVRLRIVRAFGRDDALIVTAMVFNVGFAACTFLSASSGTGKTPEYLADRPDDVRRGFLFWWLGQIIYIITVTIGRLSIAITLLRLTVERIHQWILYAVMALSTAVGIVFLFFAIFQCQPVSYYWNRLSMEGHCLDMNSLLGVVYMYSGVAAACDFTMGLLPVSLIWRLQMDNRTKLAVAGILGIACIASAAVIVRIPFLSSAKSPDFLHATTQISICSNVEACLGITAGSLATVRPIIRMWSSMASSLPSQHSLIASHPIPGKRRGTVDSREDAISYSTYASHTAPSQGPPRTPDAIA
ncbi:integral membrane protein [Aspergillus bombycis]|uniref:Integral membrane protein n=1 Tax=Aspergillus bombycis TaxID=109264 RepID=A0A1F8A4I9_9EURO|nr:integral membrane protein [Aspergillus bombycis]OGM46624.1 integral membrane protein [Aspergillus bombycis]